MHTRRVLLAGIAAFVCGVGCAGIVSSRDSGASHNDAAAGADASTGDSEASDDDGTPGADASTGDSEASDDDATPGADASTGDSEASDDGGPTLDGVVPKDAGVTQNAGSDAGAGPCDRTMTQPVALATALGGLGLAVAGDWVYFGNPSSAGVSRVPKAGGPVEVPAAGDASLMLASSLPSRLALDADYVYWPALSAGVARVAIAGFSQATPSVVLPTTTGHVDGDLRGLAVDATHAYLTTTATTIYAGAKGGGSLTPFATTTGSAWVIAADPTGVYWADSSLGIYKAAADGGAPNLLQAGNTWGLALDDTSVYATSNDGRILKVSKSGTPSATLVTLGAERPFAIAVDDQSVYWSDTTQSEGGLPVGTLRKVSKTGGAVTLIATTSTQVYDLAVDGTCVYYVDTGGVMRVSK